MEKTTTSDISLTTLNAIALEKVLIGHKDTIYALENGIEENHIFSSGGDGMIVDWNLNSGDGILTARLASAVYSLYLNKSTNILFAGSRFGTLYAFDLLEKKEKAKIDLEGDVFALCSINENQLLAGTAKGYLYLLNKEDLQILSVIKASDKRCRSLAISSDGKNIASGWSDSFIRIYDSESLNELNAFEAHAHSVFSLCFLPNSEFLLSGGRDAQIKVWDTSQNYQLVKTIPAHWYTVNSLVSNNQGTLFFSGSRDKSFRIWDAAALDLLKVVERPKYEGHTHSVNKLLWLEDKQTIISASDDRKLKVWKMNLEAN